MAVGIAKIKQEAVLLSNEPKNIYKLISMEHVLTEDNFSAIK